MEDAAASLARGGILAYPTEGVWGLGCDPRDEAAVLRLLDIKQRDVAKGLILIASSEAQLAPFIDMTALDDAQASTLVDALVRFRDDSEARQHGAHVPLRAFALRCDPVV